MNRIILIGNGFDLAHGLKTSYKDFIEWFWKNKATKINSSRGRKFEDDDVVIEAVDTWRHLQGSIDEQQGLEYYVGQGYLKREYKNEFLKRINDVLKFQNWVDIEEEYFKQLKNTITYSSGHQYTNIDDLNRDFEKIKKALEEYLLEEINNQKLGGFKLKNISQTFNALDFTSRGIDAEQEFKKYLSGRNTTYRASETPIYPNKTLFLNFNYTDLPIKLIECIRVNAWQTDGWAKNSFDNLFIHGKLKDENFPIIFGYGDEQDEIQKELEKHGGEYLDNIKTINYLKTQNYKRLLAFVDSEPYQIFIWGHSCGLSDKTLLNTLFEHKNCVSIKPFYYIDKSGHNNYDDIVKNIYRCFNDKALMREKVVNKSYCSEL
jgi:hypothetical protein